MEQPTHKRTIRPSPDHQTNYADFEEAEPTIEVDEVLAQKIYDFILLRQKQGDPVRWRCLINKFRDCVGDNPHYRISWIIDRLRLNKKVKILDQKIPERIITTKRLEEGL